MNYALFIAIIITLSLFEMGALYFLKKYDVCRGMRYYFMGLLFYFVTINLILFLFNYERIGIVNLSWNVFSTILGLSLGYFYFMESLSPIECVGAFLSIAGLVLMQVKNI